MEPLNILVTYLMKYLINGGTFMKSNNTLEYRMSKKMFNSILSGRSEEEKKQNPKDYVAGIVNEQFGLKGTVTNISVYDV